jgi:hypothetical protein
MPGVTFLSSIAAATGAQAAEREETQAVFRPMMHVRAVERAGERETPMQFPRQAALPGELVAEPAEASAEAVEAVEAVEASAMVLRFSQTVYRCRTLPPMSR